MGEIEILSTQNFLLWKFAAISWKFATVCWNSVHGLQCFTATPTFLTHDAADQQLVVFA